MCADTDGRQSLWHVFKQDREFVSILFYGEKHHFSRSVTNNDPVTGSNLVSTGTSENIFGTIIA